jgi:hypothetical protein
MSHDDVRQKDRQVSDKPNSGKDTEILVEFSTEEGLSQVVLFTHKKQPELAENQTKR